MAKDSTSVDARVHGPGRRARHHVGKQGLAKRGDRAFPVKDDPPAPRVEPRRHRTENQRPTMGCDIPEKSMVLNARRHH